MKLLQKNNRYYFIISVFACLAIAISFYMVTEYLIYDEVESRLRTEKRDFEEYVERNKGAWNNSCYFVENKIELLPVSKETVNNSEEFSDTLLYDKHSDKEIRFRQLSFYSRLRNGYFKIQLRKSLLESDRLLMYLTGTILSLLTIVFLVMYFTQKKISKNLWSPFYHTLSKIKSFDLSKDKDLGLLKTSIYEFEELNQVLEKMSAKMKQDYQNLKEFTENASHELQTPLALINARVEELIQSKQLSEKEMHQIHEIHISAKRISKLGSTLLLLSKIENGQFPDSETISFGQLFRKKLEEFEEIFRHHELTIHYSCQDNFECSMNASLADILLTNLIGNAVKHNLKKGEIRILLYREGFEISNTGEPLTMDSSTLFQRFKKGKQRSDSSGLGLAIAKQICLYYKLTISYLSVRDIHTIKVLKFIG